MSKQSSVEWLLKKIWLEYRLIPNDDIIEEAKAMHEEEIKNAYDHHRCIGNFENGEQYYNETFNKQ